MNHQPYVARRRRSGRRWGDKQAQVHCGCGRVLCPSAPASKRGEQRRRMHRRRAGAVTAWSDPGNIYRIQKGLKAVAVGCTQDLDFALSSLRLRSKETTNGQWLGMYTKNSRADSCMQETGVESTTAPRGSGEGQAKRKPRTCTIHPPAEPWR